MKSIVVLVLTAFVLASCQNQNQGQAPAPTPKPALQPLTPQAEAAIAEILAYTPEQATASLANRTNMSFDSFHGTQVEYTSADGHAYLWYPGNRIILPGFWKVERQMTTIRGEQKSVTVICYRYGSNTYNPATGSSGGDWECGNASFHAKQQIQSVSGDVLGLTRMSAPPFPLGKEPTTLEAIKARVDRAR